MFFLAEFYLPASAALSDVARQAATGAAQAASAGAPSTGAPVRLIHVVFVPSDETCFVLYEAGSVAEVTAAGLLAGLEFDRVATARAVL
jgi:hypothetical protein